MCEDLVQDLESPSAFTRHVDEVTVDAPESTQQSVVGRNDAQIGSVERCKNRQQIAQTRIIRGNQQRAVSRNAVSTGYFDGPDQFGQYRIRSGVQASIAKNRVELGHIRCDPTSRRSA
jgi:hypothetical protein